MFCPEDGTKIEPRKIQTNVVFYPPCPNCQMEWVYNGEYGAYETCPEDYEEEE